MDYQVTGLGASRALVKWIYEKKPGTVSDPLTVGDQYVVAVITGENKEGLQSVATARVTVEPILRNKKKSVLLTQKFGKYSSLDDAAKNVSQTIQQIDSLKFSDNFKPVLGNESIVIGAAFDKAYQSKPSPVLSGNSGVYVVAINNIGALPNDAANVEEQGKRL